MSKSFNDIPDEILDVIFLYIPPFMDVFISFRRVCSRWNDAILRRLTKVKYLIEPRNKYYIEDKPDYSDKTENLIEPIAIEVLFTGYWFNQRKENRRIIDHMKIITNLQAVSVDVYGYDNKDLDQLFSYLNTRPEIQALELFGVRRLSVANQVKLKYISMFSAYGSPFEDSLISFFPPNHRFKQLWTNDSINVIDILDSNPGLQKFYQKINDESWIYDADDFPIFKKLGSPFKNLEICGFYFGGHDFSDYLNNLVNCCPNLKNVHLFFNNIDPRNVIELKNERTHEQVESLVIYGVATSWNYIEQILRMFPLIRNLKLVCQHLTELKASKILQDLPNLSTLYLRSLPFIKLESGILSIRTEPLNKKILSSKYESFHGKSIQIIINEDVNKPLAKEIPFSHGFNFIKNIFFSDNLPYFFID